MCTRCVAPSFFATPPLRTQLFHKCMYTFTPAFTPSSTPQPTPPLKPPLTPLFTSAFTPPLIPACNSSCKPSLTPDSHLHSHLRRGPEGAPLLTHAKARARLLAESGVHRQLVESGAYPMCPGEFHQVPPPEASWRRTTRLRRPTCTLGSLDVSGSAAPAPQGRLKNEGRTPSTNRH